MNKNKLRDLYGPATEKASAKIMKSLDAHSVQFIESSNFLVIGTFDGEDIDLSPKGDPGGFVKVLSQDRIEIADRPGNNRIDGLLNISNNSIAFLYSFSDIRFSKKEILDAIFIPFATASPCRIFLYFPCASIA